MNTPSQLSPQTRTLRLLYDFWLTCGIYAAARLDIAGLLKKEEQTVDALARATGSHAPSLYRLLRALAGEGFFQETSKGTFALTSSATVLLDDEPGSMKAFVQCLLGEHFLPWGQLVNSVRTGAVAFDHHYKMNLWQYYEKHPGEGLNFMNAMTGLSQYANSAIVNAYDFSGHHTVVDVAGGNGALLLSILEANPSLQGIVFDLPRVVEKTTAAIVANGLQERCRVIPGSFFEAVPPDGDLYIMKYILHDWHDEDALLILSNCSRAMKKGAKILVIDAVIPEGNIPHPGKLMDLNMLVATGGLERTEYEFRHLFAQAGLQFNKVIDLSIPDLNIVEGEKC